MMPIAGSMVINGRDCIAFSYSSIPTLNYFNNSDLGGSALLYLCKSKPRCNSILRLLEDCDRERNFDLVIFGRAARRVITVSAGLAGVWLLFKFSILFDK